MALRSFEEKKALQRRSNILILISNCGTNSCRNFFSESSYRYASWDVPVQCARARKINLINPLVLGVG